MIEYEIFQDEGTILISSVDDSFVEYYLKISSFWRWVRANELNTYCNDYYDTSEQDGHGQDAGKLTKEEYFNRHHLIIKEDLIKFLQQSHLRNNKN